MRSRMACLRSCKAPSYRRLRQDGAYRPCRDLGRARASKPRNGRSQPMKIVVFGATGNVGRRVVKEALGRGHTVTGVARKPLTLSEPGARAVSGDATTVASVIAAVP